MTNLTIIKISGGINTEVILQTFKPSCVSSTSGATDRQSLLYNTTGEADMLNINITLT